MAAAQEPRWRPPGPCSVRQFVDQLLQVADETQPARVPAAFARVFGTTLTGEMPYFVSGPIEGAQKNEVAQFVRLGQGEQPLRLGPKGQCVTLAALELALKADGWEGGASPTPGPDHEIWRYLKGHTQLTATPAMTGSSRPGLCAASIVITFR